MAREVLEYSSLPLPQPPAWRPAIVLSIASPIAILLASFPWRRPFVDWFRHEILQWTVAAVMVTLFCGHIVFSCWTNRGRVPTGRYCRFALGSFAFVIAVIPWIGVGPLLWQRYLR